MQKVNQKSNIQSKKIISYVLKALLLLATLISASAIILIVYQLAVRGLRPLFGVYTVDGFTDVKLNIRYFFTGMEYIGYLKDFNLDGVLEGAYGIGYLIINTIFNVGLSLLLATPIGILTAVFIVKMAPNKLGQILQVVVEMLAAVPSVVIGMFGQGFIAGIIKNATPVTGNFSLLNTVIVLTIMILPTITMMSTTALRAIPRSIEEGSLALGATETQTMFKVVLPAAKSGIFAGVILAVGRALGEASAVSLVAGGSGSGPNFNIFGRTNTLSSRILMGFKEVSEGSFDFEVRFTMGLVLIAVILFFNIVLNAIKKRVANYEL